MIVLDRLLLAFMYTLLAGFNFEIVTPNSFAGVVWLIAAVFNFVVVATMTVSFRYDRN
jgi:hypothetical protein